MTQTEHHVWPYKVHRPGQDEALEFLSFQYDDNTPGLSARVRINGEEAHVTTPRDLDPQEREEFIESIREHFRTRDIAAAYETVFEASRQPGHNRPIPDIHSIDEGCVSESDRLALLRWELGAHIQPITPKTEADFVVLQRERFTRDAGDLFEHLEWKDQRDLVRVVDVARAVLEQEADILSRLEEGTVNEHVLAERVSQIQIGLLDFELLNDDFLDGLDTPNETIKTQAPRILRVVGEQMDDALARIESYADQGGVSKGEEPEYILDPAVLKEVIVGPEEFLPGLSEEQRSGFQVIEDGRTDGVAPEELFPKSFLPAYEDACRYLAMKADTSEVGMELLARTGRRGEEFLGKVWANLSGIGDGQEELLSGIAQALGRVGSHTAVEFLCEATESSSRNHNRYKTRAIAEARRSAALQGLELVGESESVFTALASQFEAAPHISDPALLRGMSKAHPDRALELFRTRLLKSFLRNNDEHVGVMLQHIQEHGDSSDLKQLFSIHPFTSGQEELLYAARAELISKEPSWFKRMGYRLEQMMSSRADHMGSEEWEKQIDEYQDRFRNIRGR